MFSLAKEATELTTASLAQLGEHQSAEQEVVWVHNPAGSTLRWSGDVDRIGGLKIFSLHQTSQGFPYTTLLQTLFKYQTIKAPCSCIELAAFCRCPIDNTCSSLGLWYCIPFRWSLIITVLYTITCSTIHFRLQFIKVCKGRLLSCLCKRHLEPDSLPQIKAIKLLYSCLSFTYSLKAYKSTANNYCNFG